MTTLRSLQFVLPVLAVGAGALDPVSVSAQATMSRPVVQPLPSSDVRDLKESLRVLARSPRDLNALIDAGYASLKVQDFDAAIGFFGRAEEVSPEHPRVKMGKAAVYLRSGRPIEALRLFSEAEAAGASAKDVHSDRGLAYDLVGDQLRAQAHYREALRETPGDNETIRRMAVSQAISGNEDAFLKTLRPLIDKRDFPAFRSQAFGLAILGENDRAKAVTEAVMPADLARRIVPYLGYMPRLTKAQQAAAANLGIFPKAADIGRDSPVIAQYTSQERAAAASTVLARSANNRLEPSGAPLGSTTSTPQRPTPNPRRSLAGPGFDLKQSNPTVRVNGPSEAPVRVTRAATPAVQTPPPAALIPQPASKPVVQGRPVAASTPPPVAKPTTAVTPEPAPSFADAFSDLGGADTSKVAVAGDAVDISKIAIRREAKPKPKPEPKPEPKKPANPERYWVQLGTASQAEGLKFDWRRLSRKESDLLGGLKGYTAPYGDKHRLLAGPVSSRQKRDELVSALTEKGLGVLPFTSPEGMEVQPLK